MKIVEAERADAPLIGLTVVTAIGEEIAHNLAGDRPVDDVTGMFAALAARDDSQYSYRNTLKAVDANSEPMGFIVGYDGARLHELRRAFVEEARRHLGLEFDGDIPDECSPDEFYLDSLAVDPRHRGKGVARALITAMSHRAATHGKPLGLLCDKTNSRARRLYTSLGFKKAGELPFAGELMDHLQLSPL